MSADAPLKIDTQRRTTFAGFGYSNDDPANQHDRRPTSISYIDLSLRGQQRWLESEIGRQRGEARQELNEALDSLNEAIEMREMRRRGLFGLRPKREPKAVPDFGQELTAFTLLMIWVALAQAIPALHGWPSSLGLLAIAFVFLATNVSFEPEAWYELRDSDD